MQGRSDIKPTNSKRCQTCGVTITRKRFSSGRLESVSAFSKRRFCSLSCANSVNKGGVSQTRCHVVARKHIKERCEVCGSSQNLHVHHCDENWRNNSLENLQTLCASCHKLWHVRQKKAGVNPVGRMDLSAPTWKGTWETDHSQREICSNGDK